MTSLHYMPLDYSIKHNKNILLHKENTLAMVYALHKFIYFLLGNKFVFYVHHMVVIIRI